LTVARSAATGAEISGFFINEAFLWDTSASLQQSEKETINGSSTTA
jgi:hypothetical protein